jgi:NADH-quinone oxidoreductase subunit N
MSYLSTLSPAHAEIFLLVMACIILIVDLFVVNQRKTLTYALVQLTLAGLALITVETHSPGVAYLFHNMFVDDLMSDVLKFLSYISVSMILVYSRQYLLARLVHRRIHGADPVCAARHDGDDLGQHFLSMYIGLELMSLSLYAMVALQRTRHGHRSGDEIFILGALASGLLLYGMSMLLVPPAHWMWQAFRGNQARRSNPNLLVFGLVFVVAGLAFKLGAVPFHMWVPDVYQGSPTAVVMLIGSAPKLAAFAFIMRMLVEGMQPMMVHWSGMLVILAVLSMAVGNISAIAQTNLKRMLPPTCYMGTCSARRSGIDGYGS